MKGRRASLILVVVVAVFVLTCACIPKTEPTPTPTPTPTPMPTVDMTCTVARDSVQVAISVYYAANAEWPTLDGEPGAIDWGKLVPDFMDAVPTNDAKCHWAVNSSPLGVVCVQNRC